MPDDLVVMASIGAPHGVRGAVRLTVYAEEPLALRRYNPFRDAAGRSYRLTAVRAVGAGGIAAEIDGITTREAAAALRGTLLAVPRQRLPRPAEDEFYHVDLVGLTARLVDGTVLGTVRGVADYGAGDVLEVAGAHAVLIPFTKAVVPVVDVAAGHLVIDPPPGLLDEPEEPAGAPAAADRGPPADTER